MQRKILLIAPDTPSLPPLKKTGEISTIQRNHDTRILSGTVSGEDVTNAITEDDYQIIWFVTHGNESGVCLTSEMLGIDALIQYAKSESVELVIFNTCESEDVALRVAGEAQVSVICTISTVENQDAVRLGQLLAVKLTEDISYRDAYDSVSSGSSNYRFYGSGSNTRSAYRSTSTTLDDDVEALKRAVFGEYGIGGLIHQVDRALTEIEKIKKEVEKFAKFEPLLISIDAMQKNSASVPVYVFYGVLFLVLLSIVALIFIIATGRSV